ncbi:MAG: phosphopentomutase [Clostridia bacterium]|nr:phosphopentomutase [Clostridia bacterium]
MKKKVIVLVLDSVGIGALPDANLYDDVGADTLGHVINAVHPSLPNMMAMGLGNIEGATFPGAVSMPTGAYGKAAEVSPGKDTTTGHWEIAGAQLTQPFPTFPNGFPKDFLEEFSKETGRGYIGNKPASGTAIIEELGEQHLATGDLIVYTSADSVFQIAANERIVPVEELYRDCEIARKLLKGPLEVGRVIARPFEGERAGEFKRTSRRRDFSAMPPVTMCDLIANSGKTVYAIGKIEDIFAHKGITVSNHAAGNPACLEAALAAQAEDYEGLLFVNLVDTDMIYGHRRDVEGYARALEEVDRNLPTFMEAMGPEDLLILTADHGCDPTYKGTDHTREYIPILVWGKGIKENVNLGIRPTFADISATILDALDVENTIHGTSFYPLIRKA